MDTCSNIIMGRRFLMDARVIQVFRYIQSNPGSYLTIIAEDLKLPKGTVYNCLRVLEPFIDRDSVADSVGISLPNLPTLITAKEGATEILVSGWIKKRKSLKGIL